MSISSVPPSIIPSSEPISSKRATALRARQTERPRGRRTITHRPPAPSRRRVTAPPPKPEFEENAEKLADNPDPSTLPDMLTVDELAALLRINRKTVYGEIAAGRIPGVRRFGARRPVFRAHRDTVLNWLVGHYEHVRSPRRTP
jgi:excisionase family DNA binding protein